MIKVDTFKEALLSYRAILGAVVIFSAAINALMFVGPLYMLQVYDRVLQSRSEVTLLALTLIAVAMLIVYGVLEWIRSRVLVRAGMQFDSIVASPLFTRVVSSALSSPSARSEFALVDIDRLREFLTGAGLIALCDVPWVPIFLAVCFFFHPWIGWVATAGAVVIFILAILNEVATKKTLNEANTSSQAAQHFANTTLQNVEVIRALGMEKSLRGRWSAMHRKTLELQATASDRAGVLLSASKFVRMVLQVAILGTGAYLALEKEISPGVMVAASIMMGRALAPVDQVVGQWKQFIGARTAYGRLKDLFSRVPGEAERLELPAPEGRMAAENLIVAPPGSRSPIIAGVSFVLEPGEALAVVGPSGAGKSSLVRALVGVWQPLSGAVRLDGSELQHWNADELGKHVGYLPQTVELFAGTIAENIARFKEASDADIVLAAQRAGVHELIQSLPDGYETQIGVGGRQLSGGQRQRIGLARALFGDPAVLILDEPNANLDMDGEEALVRSLRDLKERKRTVMFVSHKIGLLALSDKALILADGRMRAFGPTKEVLQPKAVAPSAPVQQIGEGGAPRNMTVAS
ncbi:type I secretion system permease/ATPase [Tianweitania sediminis]|uniref:Type I secretion system permease/ATPase n=1 Tax=Tianweitania sediminis TaxID=1502156 RepID=A0A8J7UHT3_9HYPH|nr:type I secretion system permease/ATPase [Tianweitania sediminis]MBP0439534.1 type I secretion system permease/ATPase [Tianweitania sediminis]